MPYAWLLQSLFFSSHSQAPSWTRLQPLETAPNTVGGIALPEGVSTIAGYSRAEKFCLNKTETRTILFYNGFSKQFNKFRALKNFYVYLKRYQLSIHIDYRVYLLSLIVIKLKGEKKIVV